MSTAILKYVLGAGVSCALAFSFANPSNAFPALTSTTTVKSSMPSWSPMCNTIVVAMADATTVVAMDMAELQPVQLSAVRFLAGCSQRLMLWGRPLLRILAPATTHTDRPQGVQWLTA